VCEGIYVKFRIIATIQSITKNGPCNREHKTPLAAKVKQNKQK